MRWRHVKVMEEGAMEVVKEKVKEVKIKEVEGKKRCRFKQSIMYSNSSTVLKDTIIYP